MPAPSRELILHQPQAGTYATRFVKGGPRVPIRVDLVADESDPDGWRMQATVDGKRLGYAYSKQEIEAECVIWVLGGRPKEDWTPAERLLISILIAACGEPIGETEYERLLELRRTMPPWHPCHRPYEKIDLSQLPPLGRAKER